VSDTTRGSFVDLFYTVLTVSLLLVSFLPTIRFITFSYSCQLAIISWSILVAAAVSVAVILLLEFFSLEKGIERLA
jgi:hypothetical protein